MYDFVGRMTLFVTKGSLLTAIVLLLSLLDVICCASEARSAVCRGPIPDIDSSTSYCFYYGKWNDCVIQDIVKRFKLVILHPGTDFPNITPDQVAKLKAAGVIVIGYISFGEDYICTRTENGRGTVYYDAQDCGLIYKDQGYAPWYVDEVDNATGEPGHDGVPDRNNDFGTCYVNAGDPCWQEFIKTATIKSQAFAGADYILNTLGCDGLFIDCIETAVPWLPYDWSWRGMFDLVDKISHLYPEKYMVANRPLFACRLDLDPYPLTCCDGDPDCINFCFCDFSSQDEARDAFRCNINAFVWESYAWDKDLDTYNFIITREGITRCADNSDGRGFNVLVLDYYNRIKSLYTCMDYQVKEVQDFNWLDYIAPGPLDHIGYWVYNYLNNLCYPLMDGYFDDWEWWNVSYCRTDPCGDVPRKSADIVDIAVAHDPEYLYLMIHCGESIEFFSNLYRIFLGSGANVLSYKGPQRKWKGEFDYRWENGKLYRYAGSGSDWMWEEIPSTSSYGVRAEDATRMEVNISRCSIGADEGDGRVATKVLFNAEALDLNSNDYAPDDPEQDYYLYEYEPLIVIDGDMEDWENMPKDCGNLCCTFSDDSGNIQDCSVDMDKLSICSDLSSIYLKMEFACGLPQPLWGDKFYQVFIDVDQSQLTGYNACEWKIGAEYLWENGSLFKHIGESSCDWLWELIPEAGTEYAVGLSDKSQIEVSIPRPSIVVPLCMLTLSQASPLRLVCRVFGSGVVLDGVPDSPDKNFLPWPACLTQTSIHLKKGFNLIAIPSDVTNQPDLKDWLPVLGDSSEIEKVMVYDGEAGKFVTLIPDSALNPSFILKGGEGLIVYAKHDMDITFTSVLCSSIDLKTGFNLVGIACPNNNYTAFQFLSDLGSENVSSIQRYVPDKGVFETAGFEFDGQPVGFDFPIVRGKGYFIFTVLLGQRRMGKTEIFKRVVNQLFFEQDHRDLKAVVPVYYSFKDKPLDR